MDKKKLYYVTCECDEGGNIAVVNHNSRKAIINGRRYLRNQGCECEFTDFRCKWKKDFQNVNLQNMEIGEVDDFILGLKEGIYHYIYGSECPKCGSDDYMISIVNGEIMCSECEDKLEETLNLNKKLEGNNE